MWGRIFAAAVVVAIVAAAAWALWPKPIVVETATIERRDLIVAAIRWGVFPRVHAWQVGANDATRQLLEEHRFARFQRADAPMRSEGLLVRRLAGGSAPPWMLGARDLTSIANWDLRMLYSSVA